MTTTTERIGDVRVVRGMSNEDYHNDPAYGSTTLKKLGTSLTAKFRDTSLSTNSTTLGTHWHTMRELGSDVFESRAVIVPDKFATAASGLSKKKDAVEWAADQPEDAILLTRSQKDTLDRMDMMFWRNRAAVEIAENIKEQEVSLFWTEHGVDCKVRPDAWTKDYRLIDWKSTSEENILGTFGRTVTKYGYGLSAVHYHRGLELAGIHTTPMEFVVTSTTSYETQVMYLPAHYLRHCREQLDKLLKMLGACQATDDWTPIGYGQVNETTGLYWR